MHDKAALAFMAEGAPPAGFEPALTAPEAVALSPELWGLCDTKGYQPQRSPGPVAGMPRYPPRPCVLCALRLPGCDGIPSRTGVSPVPLSPPVLRPSGSARPVPGAGCWSMAPLYQL